MTIRAVRVLRIQVMLRTRGLFSADTVCNAVARQTELRYAARDQQAWIGRTVWRVARDAPVRLNWSMLVNKRTLLIDVTLKASSVGADRQPRLFQFKSAVRIVAIAALDHPFQHFVMEWQLKLVFRFAVTTKA